MIVSMHRRLHAADSADDVFVCVRMQVVQPWVLLLDGTRTREEMSELVKRMLAAVVTLEGALAKGRPFFGGDSVGYVDIALGGFVAWVQTRDLLSGLKHFNADKTPLLAAWLERFGALNETQAVMPDVMKLVELSKKRQAQAAAAAAAVVQGN